MELTGKRREELLAYCRIDAEAIDVSLLDPLYRAAVSYLREAGVSEPPEGTDRRAQYDLCVNHLVLNSYDLRDSTVPGNVAENPMFRRMLNQLKVSEAANPQAPADLP